MKMEQSWIMRMALSGVLALAALHSQAWAQGGPGGVPRPQGQNPNGMHIYLWDGLKSHQVGQHDYPQFLADWSKLLTERGAVVDGSLHAPSAADLEKTDVIVIYKGDAGFMSDAEKATIDAFVKRGGGLVNLHDSLCGPDPGYMAGLLGGGKKHGEVNYTLEAPIHYNVVDTANPIMKDMSDITISDEAFFKMTWAPNSSVHALANVTIPGTPQRGRSQRRSGAPDLDVRTYRFGWPAGAGIRLDAGPHVCQFR